MDIIIKHKGVQGGPPLRVMDQRPQKYGIRGCAPGGVRGGVGPPPPYPIKITASNITESGWSSGGVIRVTPLPKKISQILRVRGGVPTKIKSQTGRVPCRAPVGVWDLSLIAKKFSNITESGQSPGGFWGWSPKIEKKY